MGEPVLSGTGRARARQSQRCFHAFAPPGCYAAPGLERAQRRVTQEAPEVSSAASAALRTPSSPPVHCLFFFFSHLSYYLSSVRLETPLDLLFLRPSARSIIFRLAPCELLYRGTGNVLVVRRFPGVDNLSSAHDACSEFLFFFASS